MSDSEMMQLEWLRDDPEVASAIEVLTPEEYQNLVQWLNDHFTFPYNQQIDWSHDPTAVHGKIADLSVEKVYDLLRPYGVQPAQKLTVLWAYGDTGIRLPLSLIAQHLQEIWVPVVDDVFVLDPRDTWCLELHHEGEYSCGRSAS